MVVDTTVIPVTIQYYDDIEEPVEGQIPSASAISGYVTDTVNEEIGNVQFSQIKAISDILSFLGNTPDSNLVNTQKFTASGTWTKPTGATRVFVRLWAGGGAGASSSGENAGGGAGGAYSERWFNASDLGATETVTVGAGGVVPGGNSNGGDGGNSSFGSHISATGGAGGVYNSTSIANRGLRFSLFNSSEYAGNGGGNRGNGENTVYGGGGGGASDSSATSGGVSIFGGAGGAGSGADGTAGSVPAGGGGAGGFNGGDRRGGAGARGQVEVYTLLG